MAPFPDNPTTADLRTRLARVRRRILRHRRGIAVTLTALAVYLAVQAATAAPPARVQTWVAARDLPSGTVLRSGDLAEAGFAPGTVPGSAVSDASSVLGRTLAAPLGEGVPLTTGSVVADGWLKDRAGLAAVPLRVTDPAVVGLLGVGDTVRLVAADPEAPDHAEVLADDAVVLAIPPDSSRDLDTALTGRLVVFGVREADAADITAVATARYVSVVWNP
jgi:hypothetical protein